MNYLLALDQGTTSSRAILYDEHGTVISSAQKELSQFFPQDGWVEEDAEELFQTQLYTAEEALKNAHVCAREVRGIGISNQRETTVVWEKETGKPITNAVVWQCRRGAPYCETLAKNEELMRHVREELGLSADAYFSASKLAWILEHVPNARRRAENGELLFGTVDSFLLYRFTGKQVHKTDATNASRTLLWNQKDGRWDETLLRFFDIPHLLLPEVCDTLSEFGSVDPAVSETLGGIPILAMAGDQQAALYGEGCHTSGTAKCTYGTGGFLLANTGDTMACSTTGLITTVALQRKGKRSYAMEGSVFHAGSAVQWLRDELHLIETAHECDTLAESVSDSAGVIFVPAFTGLGAPIWDMYARGAFFGMTRACTKAHLARAVLEGIAYQVADVLFAMREELKTPLKALYVDGGVSRSDPMLQFQADLLQLPVLRGTNTEASAKGVAAMAGIEAGLFDTPDAFLRDQYQQFSPKIDENEQKRLLKRWKKAVNQVRIFAQEE